MNFIYLFKLKYKCIVEVKIGISNGLYNINLGWKSQLHATATNQIQCSDRKFDCRSTQKIPFQPPCCIHLSTCNYKRGQLHILAEQIQSLTSFPIHFIDFVLAILHLNVIVGQLSRPTMKPTNQKIYIIIGITFWIAYLCDDTNFQAVI